MNAPSDVARTAGRGVVYITAAKLYFIVAGYAIHFALPRLLGDTSDRSKVLYGLYGVVASVVNLLSTVMIQGTLQTVSKLVSEDESRAGEVRRAALRVEALVGGSVALAYFALGGLVAEFQKRPDLALPHRVCSAIVLFYGFYAVFIGVLNGRKQFRQQALFDMSYATLKMGFVIGAAALGFSVEGVFAGWAAVAFLIALVAAAVVEPRAGRSSRDLERRMLAFIVPVMLYAFVLNVLLNVDLWLLQRLVADPATTGDYTAAQVLARIPYQATLSVTFVVFPLVSRSTFAGDREATRETIRVTLRYSLVILVALVAVIGGAAEDVVVVPYPETFRSAGPPLAVLSGGMLLFALFTILGSILTGSGRAGLSLTLGAVTLGLDAGLCYLLIPAHGAVGAALATTVALAAGTIGALVAVWRLFGAGIPALSAARIALAGAAVVGAAQALPSPSRLLTVAKCAGLAALYFGALVLTRELGRADWERLRNVFSRRARAKEAT